MQSRVRIFRYESAESGTRRRDCAWCSAAHEDKACKFGDASEDWTSSKHAWRRYKSKWWIPETWFQGSVWNIQHVHICTKSSIKIPTHGVEHRVPFSTSSLQKSVSRWDLISSNWQTLFFLGEAYILGPRTSAVGPLLIRFGLEKECLQGHSRL